MPKFRKRRSKYPDIGVLDAMYKWAFGTGFNEVPRDVVYAKLSGNELISRDFFSKRVYELKRGGFIKYSPSQELVLTEKGLARVNFHKLDSVQFTSTSRRRDGLWRIISFDIPEQMRSARDLLRSKLNELNFYKLQKSVYVTPYVCEKEIEQIIKVLNLFDYVNIIVAKSLGRGDGAVRKYFRI